MTKVGNRFNASLAEVGYLDLWQRSAIVIAVVSSDRVQVEKSLAVILSYIEGNVEGEVTSVSTEIL
jgi:uncharacterized protein YlxP (DUF503 family)